MSVERAEQYESLLGRIEEKLGSHSREQRRKAVQRASSADDYKQRQAQRVDADGPAVSKTPTQIGSRGLPPQPPSTGQVSPSVQPASRREPQVPGRNRLIDEERWLKEDPHGPGIIQCVLPLVMEHVKAFLGQFKRDMIVELRREASLCASVKVQDFAEEIRHIQAVVAQHREDLEVSVERSVRSAVEVAMHREVRKFERERKDFANHSRTHEPDLRSDYEVNMPHWNNSTLSKHVPSGIEDARTQFKDLLRGLRIRSNRAAEPSGPPTRTPLFAKSPLHRDLMEQGNHHSKQATQAAISRHNSVEETSSKLSKNTSTTGRSKDLQRRKSKAKK